MKGPELRVTVNASNMKPEGSSEYIYSDHSDSLSPFPLPSSLQRMDKLGVRCALARVSRKGKLRAWR